MPVRARLRWILGACLCAGVLTASNAERVDLVLLAGQSNIVGQANVTAGVPGADPADADVLYYYDVTNTGGTFSDDSGGAFGLLQPWQFIASTQRFGPEMTLGRDLHAALPNQTALLKHAIGGSNIARWLPGAIDYVGFVSAVTTQINQLEADGDTVNVVGMVWLQGESDVINTARADAYAANLGTFISTLRSDLDTVFPALGFNALRVFLTEPADWKNGSNPGIATAANIAKVDQALVDFATNDADAWFIPTDDFTQFEDNLIHFSGADQMTLGSRMATAIVDAALIPGDADFDGDVDLDDFNLLAVNFGQTGSTGTGVGDFDGDGDTDLDDFNLLAVNFGSGVSEQIAVLPEPGTCAMLVVSLWALLRRMAAGGEPAKCQGIGMESH